MRLAQTSVLLLLAAFAGVSTAPAQVAVGISITVAPPVLPVYDQPPIPAPGYIWTPGYWAWDDGDYYWVPGTWVEPPAVGVLWTPGYWGWRDGIYAWNAGYWGPHVGFYGGVNYGFGYGGVGYGGGFWRGGVFSYNTTVNNFGGVHITNVYNKTVIVNNNVTNVSYSGGAGGTRALPTKAEQVAAREHHVDATPAQAEHQHAASTNPQFRAAANGGHPAVGGTSTPGRFTGEGVAATHPHPGGAEAGGHVEGGGAPNANHLMGGNHPAGGNPVGGNHPAPAAARPAGGNNAPKVSNASLNAGHPGGKGTPPAGGPPHMAPPQAAPKGGGAPPRVATAVRPPPAARPAAPRPAARPAPKGPPPQHHQ